MFLSFDLTDPRFFFLKQTLVDFVQLLPECMSRPTSPKCCECFHCVLIFLLNNELYPSTSVFKTQSLKRYFGKIPHLPNLY